MERRLGELYRRIDRITALLIKGQGDVRVLDKEIKDAAAERDQLEAGIGALKEEDPNLKIEPHPTLIKRYLDIIRKLQPLLERRAQADDPDLIIIRELIEAVVIYPDKKLRIVGRLNALTGAFRDLGTPTGSVWGAMVAEVRFDQSPRHATDLFSFKSN